MLRKVLFLSLLSLYSYSEELSVFGAGDLGNSTPYGLTKSEQNILKNKKDLGTIDIRVKGVKSSIDLLNERIDGLESLIDGDSKLLNKLKLDMNSKKESNVSDMNKDDIYKIKSSFNDYLSSEENISKEYEKNIKLLKLAINNISKLVNSINDSYISKEELNKNNSKFLTKDEFKKFQNLLIKDLQEIGKSKKIVSVKKDIEKNTPKSSISKKSKKELMKEVRHLFKKDNFTKAIPILKYLISKKYRPAENNYYMGEIKYYRKKYSEAIPYFKTSATLYQKAAYMPKLLLHSAISFENTGDVDNAVNFYSSLLGHYENSKEAKEAKKRLNTLQ